MPLALMIRLLLSFISVCRAATVLTRLNHGKMVYEFKPKIDWNKGKALVWLLQALHLDEHDNVFTIYIGDDTTDEDAFEVFQDVYNRKGVGIIVTEESTSTGASFTLRNTDEVCEFLNRLISCGCGNRAAAPVEAASES